MRPKQIPPVFQILSFGHSTQTLWATLAPQTQTGGSMSRRRYPSCRSASPNCPLMQPLRDPSRQSCPPGFAHRECLFSIVVMQGCDFFRCSGPVHRVSVSKRPEHSLHEFRTAPFPRCFAFRRCASVHRPRDLYSRSRCRARPVLAR